MKYTDLIKEERPQYRMENYGVEFLTNNDLLHLATNNNDMETVDNISALFTRNPELITVDILKASGMTKKQINALLAGIEIGKRLITRQKRINVITGPEDIAGYLIPQYRYKQKEHFGILCLNCKNHIIGNEVISVGSLMATVVQPREVLKQALKYNSCSIVLYHNHPSEDPTPSRDDINTTNRLIKAAEVMDIPILDHIIIGGNRYVSLKEKGLI